MAAFAGRDCCYQGCHLHDYEYMDIAISLSYRGYFFK
jgi:hypothetical protein